MSRIYAIHKPALKQHCTITGPSRDGQAQEHLFTELHRSLTKTPLVAVHDGPDGQAPVVAVSHLPPFAKHFQIGVGDPTAAQKQVTDMQWEEMRMAHPSGKKYTWAANVAGDEDGDGAGQPRRMALAWTRTRHATVDGMKRPPLSTRNYKLTETADGDGEEDVDGRARILAVFTSSMQRGCCGHLQINVDRGREFDLMVWVTCLSLYALGR